MSENIADNVLPRDTADHNRLLSMSPVVDDNRGLLCDLIPMIDKIHEVMGSSTLLQSEHYNVAEFLDLPQIVVIGAQSVGKSSVLEALVGEDFLPRGIDVVTRRPLELHLRRVNGTAERWGEFAHLPGRKFAKFDEIRNEIQRATDELLGQSKAISDCPISLSIYSPLVIDLTLIDLPGVTKIPMDGQPADIESQTRNVVLSYIKRESTIILAISPANADIANSDSLNLARVVDPEGKRTVGVLTKIDLMDKGTNALDILIGRSYHLERGHFAVICRSQIDINKQKTKSDGRYYEENYFGNHVAYTQVASKCGLRNVSLCLNKMLITEIQSSLPRLRSRINQLIDQQKQTLPQYTVSLLDETTNSIPDGMVLLQFFFKFAKQFEDAINGKLSPTNSSTTELCGGARINSVFHNIFGKALSEMSPLDGLSDSEIQITIRNATGLSQSLFVSQDAFETLVKRQISKLQLPAIQCITQVYDELRLILERCMSPEVKKNYTALRDSVMEVGRNVLRRCFDPTTEMVTTLISIELAYINTGHPDFVGCSGLIPSTTQDSQDSHYPLYVQNIKKREQAKDDSAQNRYNFKSLIYSLLIGGGSNRRPASVISSSDDLLRRCMLSQWHDADESTRINTHPIHRSAPPALNPPLCELADEEQQKDRSGGYTSTSVVELSKHLENCKLPLASNQWIAGTTARLSEKNRLELQLVKTCIVSYFNIVRKNIFDLVPKTIMHLMVNKAKNEIQKELVSKLYKEELYDGLLRESHNIAERRQACKTALDCLKTASNILDSIDDRSMRDDEFYD